MYQRGVSASDLGWPFSRLKTVQVLIPDRPSCRSLRSPWLLLWLSTIVVFCFVQALMVYRYSCSGSAIDLKRRVVNCYHRARRGGTSRAGTSAAAAADGAAANDAMAPLYGSFRGVKDLTEIPALSRQRDSGTSSSSSLSLPPCPPDLSQPFYPLLYSPNVSEPPLPPLPGRSKINRMDASDERRPRRVTWTDYFDYRYDCGDPRRPPGLASQHPSVSGGSLGGLSSPHAWRFYTVDEEHPVWILEWGHSIGGFGGDRQFGCDVPCRLTHDRSWAENGKADIVVFGLHLENEVETLQKSGKKKPHQYYAVTSLESDVNYPSLKDKNNLKRFDLKTTYHLDSDVPRIYFGYRGYDWMLPPRAKRKDRLVSFVASNCTPKNGRTDFVMSLSRYISVQSFGHCLRNANPNDVLETPIHNDRWHEKVVMLQHFKFNVAFENSDTPDYVTEKFGQALVAGTVPIVKSRANNYETFAPHPHSYIVADDFESPKALAEYLLYLNDHDEEYDKYLEWKRVGPSESFRRLLELNIPDSSCHLCRFAALARDIDAGYVNTDAIPPGQTS